jgi:hypothetical protein
MHRIISILNLFVKNLLTFKADERSKYITEKKTEYKPNELENIHCIPEVRNISETTPSFYYISLSVHMCERKSKNVIPFTRHDCIKIA